MSDEKLVNDRYMNVDALAEYLMMSPNTIRKYVRTKKIPFIKVQQSKLVRFIQSDIDVWMRKGIVATEPSGEDNGKVEKT